jgi:hypothetical protein
MAPPTRLRRADKTVWIEGVPTLTGWRKLPTFIGALEAALSVTEHPVSYTDLLGLSGLAFRVRWYVGPDGPTGCPCSPTGETPMVWSAIGRGTGWQLEPFDGDGWDAPGMKRIVPRIVDSIDAGRPVIAVDKDLNSSVIYGHKQDRVTFLVRTYSQDTVQCDVSGLGQSPALAVFLPRHVPPASRAQVLHAVLCDAVDAWQHETWDTTVSCYLRSGRAALEGWIDFYDRLDEATSSVDAQRVDRHKLLGHVLWNHQHLYQARWGAAAFLVEAADELPEAQEELAQAAVEYQQEVDLLATAYDGSWGGMPEVRRAYFDRCHARHDQDWLDTSIDAWDETVRQRERAILEGALQIEARAVAWLARASGAGLL